MKSMECDIDSVMKGRLDREFIEGVLSDLLNSFYDRSVPLDVSVGFAVGRLVDYISGVRGEEEVKC